MYFNFPSFKSIATQQSFNEIIHFPLHCLKSTFSFQKSCRKSEKMIFGRSFQLSSKSIFPFRNPAVSPKKNDFFGDFFTFHQNFPKSIFPLQKSCRKCEKMIFWRFFQFSANFPKSIFSLQKSCRKCEK